MKVGQSANRTEKPLKEETGFEKKWGNWSSVREFFRALWHFGSIFAIYMALHKWMFSDSAIRTIMVWALVGLVIVEKLRLYVTRWEEKVDTTVDAEANVIEIESKIEDENCVVTESITKIENAFDKIRDWLHDEAMHLLSWVNKGINKSLIRVKERYVESTAIWSPIGFVIIIYSFDRWIAAVSILFLAVIDPVAKLGKRWPYRRLKNGKSLGGLFFGFFAGLVAIYFFIHVFEQSITISLTGGTSLGIIPDVYNNIHVWSVCIVGLLTASIFELFAGKMDNLIIPIAGSLAMWGFNLLLIST